MNKKLTISIFSALAVLAMTGCGKNPTTNTDTTGPATTSNSTTDGTVTVSKVEITLKEDGSSLTEDNLTVLDGTSITLQATVTGSKKGMKVDWSSSNTEIAKVTNGVVRFLSVSENKDVTITATSRDDKTKSASVTFHVQHSKIDFSTSYGNDLDKSLFQSDGILSATAGDVAFVFADVYDTKWYVQADITYTSFTSDEAPKFGIMSGNKAGVWNKTTESDVCYQNFLYLDSLRPTDTSTWNTFDFVGQNDTNTNWNWGGQLGGFKETVRNGDTYTLGLLRDGQHYYEFFSKPNSDGTSTPVVAKKHVIDEHIPEDMATYAWVGGWSTGVDVSNFVSYTGDEVDQMFQEPTTLDVSGDGMVLFLGESYRLNVTTDVVALDRSKLSFTSSNEEVLKVSSDGILYTQNKVGQATITIKYDNKLEKEITLDVTDDVNFKVEIDGKMDDKIYTAAVKANKWRMNLNGDGEYIDFYAAMNSRGLYIFADAYVDTKKGGEADATWYQNDNFEIHFDNNATQFWASGNKKYGAFDNAYVSDAIEKNGKYNIVFETFVSYDTLNANNTGIKITKDSTIGAWIGSNPASGWKAPYQHTKVGIPSITKDGFVHGEDQYCAADQHAYSNWVVTKENTCGEDGSKERTCSYCGKVETEVIAKDESAHVLDYANATVKTASTCISHGNGDVKCSVCNKSFTNVTLPLDPTNHSGTFANDEYSCCHIHIKNGETAELDNWSATGLTNEAYRQTIASELTGSSWQVKYSYNNLSNNEDKGTAWKQAVNFVIDTTTNDTAYERLDWCGWTTDGNGDGANSLSEINGWTSAKDIKMSCSGGWCNYETELVPVLKNANINVTVTRDGAKIVSEYEITSPNVEGKTFHYTFTLSAVSNDANITLGMGVEFTKATINSAYRVY